MIDIRDTLTIRRVANGWVIQPGVSSDQQFLHVAVAPEQVAEYVRGWAAAQIETLPVKR